MKKFFADAPNRSKWAGLFKGETNAPIVRLMDMPQRPPVTAFEQRVISKLTETGPVSLANLVKTVAGEVYAEELRRGSGVLDIGLFGSRLFSSDVVRELEGGDGVLWEIIREREIG
jgi:hypothetical protein